MFDELPFRTKRSQFLLFKLPLGHGVCLKSIRHTVSVIQRAHLRWMKNHSGQDGGRWGFSQGVHETQKNKGPGHKAHSRGDNGHTSHCFRKPTVIQAHCGRKGNTTTTLHLASCRGGDMSMFIKGSTTELVGTTILKEHWERGDSLNELGWMSIWEDCSQTQILYPDSWEYLGSIRETGI